MLEEIHIAGLASYSAEGQRLSGCKPINFIFGTNGSGKTSISRVIASPLDHPTATLTWAGGQQIRCEVFNKDFADRNFSSQMRGIFTLGEESAEVQARIAALKEQQRDLNEDIRRRTVVLQGQDGAGGKLGEQGTLRASFEEICWGLKSTHDPHFKDVFEGVRNSKVRFCDKILLELENNTADLHQLDALKARAETVFKKGQTPIASLPVVSFDNIVDLEGDPSLAKKVVGKEDISIAALIGRLGNSDWVQAGRGYLDNSADHCPFCQQKLETDLKSQLEEYFDETYLADLASIQRLAQAHETYADAALQALRELSTNESSLIDTAALLTNSELLAQKFELNRRQIALKQKEPSRVVALEPIRELADTITGLIANANTAIATHNALVANLVVERNQLVGQAWKCIIEGAKGDMDRFKADNLALSRAVDGLNTGISQKSREVAEVGRQIVELERTITSVLPTVNTINATLRSFGFGGFQLSAAPGSEALYAVVRADGSDAAPTLSEGEKSFITFLYFYHLIKGSLSASGMTDDRVVVIDDPVSSLDSDVLFIVSTLIKDLLAEAVAGNGQIRQVFVLTHNIYFHKEVSFDPKRQEQARAHERFWIVRKRDGHSVLERFDHNPIKTSYELLWADVRDPNRSSSTIQNTLRRIIENYFKILGNIDKDDIVAKFDGRDKQICGSLFSWVNDGSHAMHDDLYVSADYDVIARYLDVFKAIFDRTQHSAHYNMMMGIENPAAENVVVLAEVREAQPQEAAS